MNAYLEHGCFVVNDLDWHLKLFSELFDADVLRSVDTPDGEHRRWLAGGFQLNSPAKPFDPVPVKDAGLFHLGIAVDGDCAALGRRAVALGCLPVPGKPENWFALPDGGVIEVQQARNTEAISTARALAPDLTHP